MHIISTIQACSSFNNVVRFIRPGIKWKRQKFALLRIVFSIMFFDCLTTISLSHCCLIKETTMVNQHKKEKPIQQPHNRNNVHKWMRDVREKIIINWSTLTTANLGRLVHGRDRPLLCRIHTVHTSEQTNERKKYIPRVIKKVNTRKLECLFCTRPFIYLGELMRRVV